MTNAPWKVLVVDDDEGIHSITRMVFRGYEFENKDVTLVNASSSSQAKQILNEHSDICVVLLDVVMETDNAGLNLVNYIRNTLNNSDIRIILRTGHPGFAPEAEVIIDYDINDYLSKAELSASRLLTSVVVALRSYRDIIRAKNTSKTLQLHKPQPLENTLILNEISSFFESHLTPLYTLSRDLLSFSHKPMVADTVTQLHTQCEYLLHLNALMQPLTAEEPQELQLLDMLDTLLTSYLNQAKRNHWIIDYQLSDDTPLIINIDRQWLNNLLLTLLEIAIYKAHGNNLLIQLHVHEQRLMIDIIGKSQPKTLENGWLTTLQDKLVTFNDSYQGRPEVKQESLAGFSFIYS